MVKQELSEYEQQRQANIAERDALLKKLALDAASAGVAPKPTKTPNGPGRSTKKKPQPKKVKEEVVPRRTSSRLAGIEADSEKAKRKADEEYEAVQQQARIKRQRVSGDLNLSEIVVAGNGWDKNKGAFVDVVNRGARPYERTFGETEVKETTNKELKALRERMSGLELYDGFEPNKIKITPERIYSMAFHPEPGKPLIFAGDKLGNLGIFDASQNTDAADTVKKEEDGDVEDDEDLPDPEITTLHVHTRTITSVEFSPLNPSHVYTSSYDSSIRLLDLATSVATEVYGPQDKESEDLLSGLQINPKTPEILYFSRLDGHVGRYDTRENPSSATLWPMSEKKIGGFSIHPQYPHYLATASLDRTVCLWDLRKIKWWEGEGRRPALLGSHTSRLSVSQAAFNSVGQVATSSYDDTIKIYNFEGMSNWKEGQSLDENAMEPTHVVKHNNQTGRWVTILRPQWQARPLDGVQRFVIGNMNRFVDVYAGSGEQLAQLGGDGITAVPAVAQFHPTNDWIAAGTASGKLCLWK